MPLPCKIKIMSNKLILAQIFLHNASLPRQKFRYKTSLKLLKCTAKASIYSTSYTWKLLPAVNSVTPVIQSEIVIEPLNISLILLLNPRYKCLLYIFAARTKMLCLIVKLKSNNAGIVLYHFHQLANNTLAVETVSVMCYVHNLTRTVWTSPTLICHHDIRILFCHPSWYCICWCSDNNINFFAFTSF